MILTRLTAIDADTILPIADARSQLNLTADDSFHDGRISTARALGIDFAERYTGIVFLASSFRWSVEAFQTRLPLPRGPVVSIDAITYRDSNGVAAALAVDDWFAARDHVSAAHGKHWPSGDELQVEFTAGHANLADIPPMLRAGAIVAMSAYFTDQEAPNLTEAKRCLELARSAGL